MQIEVILLITINKLPRLRQLIYFIVLISLLELRCSVVLCSGALVNMDEHVVQEVNARKDNFTLVELSDVLDSVIVEVALYGMDLIVEHESVDEHRTDLTEEYGRYVLGVLSCKVKEDTLLTSFSCEECETAVIFLLGVSGLGISVNLIDEEYERCDVVA